MDWQTLFYVLGSVFIFGWLLFLVILTVSVLVLYQKTRAIQEKISEKMESSPLPFLPLALPALSILFPLIKRLLFRSRR
jgi:hypothetical protein